MLVVSFSLLIKKLRRLQWEAADQMIFAGVTGTQGFWLRKCLKSSAHDKVTLCQGLGTIYVLCYEDTCFPQTNMPFIS